MSKGEDQGQALRAIDLAVHNELICLLFGSPSVPLINGLVALVTAGVLWRIFSFWVLASWLILSLCAVLVRLALWLQFKNRGSDSESLDRWARRFTITTAITGSLWGLMAAGAFVAPEPVYYLFAAFVVGGLSAGAAIRLSPHPPAFYTYIGTSAPPMALALFMRGQLIPAAMGGLLVTFIVVMILVGRENHQRLADYIRIKIEQEVLNSSLQRVTLDLTEQIEEKESIALALRRREGDLTTIANLSDKLQSCRTLTEAYPVIADVAASLFPRASGSLARINAETRELVRASAWGQDQFWSLERFRQEDCHALRTDHECESSGSSPAFQCQHLSVSPEHPCLCLPLSLQGRTQGLLSLVLEGGGPFDDATRQALHSFANVVKLSLSNLQLRESLFEQAIRDPLTGLFNRRYLMETLPREIGRAQRRGTPLTIAMLDIDHFKRFNDEYGHDAGDLVLTDLATEFAAALRTDDIACRYGGEEFLLALPGCSLAVAWQRLTDISVKTRSKTISFQGKSLPGTTFSIGLAALSDSLSSSESLITAADKAMYAAKRMGRDRIECFAFSPPAGIFKPSE